MMEREIDEDLRRETIDQRRALARQRCQCDDDMPGRCPGPANCPLCQDDD